VLCASASGVSQITGTRRLRGKESDRVSAMREGLAAMGVRTRENGEALLVEGRRASGAVIDPKNDHRVAMAFAVLALAARGESVIWNAECVSKSFPSFWNSVKSVGVNVEVMT
ncbi:MAG: 3-phosphoshikimate 1-carboxyvinyltransferase, partial [Anaerolineae bacterium]|nr:3-phosphoshikimate 1-carboxyvinyltransferase [Anaerolineae bacterium]NIN94469.1 3-phosphoshikimate 1-carboxyvinyltransferase [Anaerolineae bacterium]NIQ77537.1 3-phosphoshikimate 1-carboxyvinyltransferase [Anaerolineae bacterium]